MFRTMVKPTLPAWSLAPMSATERGASRWSRLRMVMIDGSAPLRAGSGNGKRMTAHRARRLSWLMGKRRSDPVGLMQIKEPLPDRRLISPIGRETAQAGCVESRPSRQGRGSSRTRNDDADPLPLLLAAAAGRARAPARQRAKGLTSEEAAERLLRHGPNAIGGRRRYGPRRARWRRGSATRWS